MQAQGAARGGGVGTPMPRGGGRRRLGELLAFAAVLVVVAVMALMTWGVVTPGAVGAQDADLKAGAGSAIVHDDAGNMPPATGSAIIHDDVGNMKP